MLSFFATLVATSSILFIIAPRMPLYEVKSLRITGVGFSIFDWTISAKLQAGVQIENANFVGADLYKTVVDLYYPDLNGELRHIGYLTETQNVNNVDVESCRIQNKESDESLMQQQTSTKDKKDYDICLQEKDNHSPIFTIHPRGISISEADALSINVENVSPSVALNLVKDAIKLRGSLDIFISGVAHVKTPLGIPLSLGVFCDNAVNLLQIPFQIVGKTCVVRSISTGWSGLKEHATEIRESALQMYQKYGTIMSKQKTAKENDSDDDEDEMAKFFNATETIIEWHDF